MHKFEGSSHTSSCKRGLILLRKLIIWLWKQLSIWWCFLESLQIYTATYEVRSAENASAVTLFLRVSNWVSLTLYDKTYWTYSRNVNSWSMISPSDAVSKIRKQRTKFNPYPKCTFPKIAGKLSNSNIIQAVIEGGLIPSLIIMKCTFGNDNANPVVKAAKQSCCSCGVLVITLNMWKCPLFHPQVTRFKALGDTCTIIIMQNGLEYYLLVREPSLKPL